MQLGASELLYVAMRLTLAGLWLAAAIDTARFARELESRARRLAFLGTGLLVLPAVMCLYDVWDNAVARAHDPVSPGSWLWLIFDGLAPIFCLLLLHTLRERNEAQEALRVIAATDPLTGLANRRGFFAQVGPVLAAARRQDRPATLVLLDLDRFKSINDACGHPAGDEVLRHVAAVLRGMLRASDLPVRWGGEEFAILLPFTGVADAVALAERLRAELRTRVPHPAGRGALVTASIGIAAVTGDTEDAGLSQAIREADRALYHVKATGRDRVVVDAGEPEPLPLPGERPGPLPGQVPGLAWADPSWRAPAGGAAVYRTT